MYSDVRLSTYRDTRLEGQLSTPISTWSRAAAGTSFRATRWHLKDDQSNSCRATDVVHSLEEIMERKKILIHPSTVLIPGEKCFHRLFPAHTCSNTLSLC